VSYLSALTHVSVRLVFSLSLIDASFDEGPGFFFSFPWLTPVCTSSRASNTQITSLRYTCRPGPSSFLFVCFFFFWRQKIGHFELNYVLPSRADRFLRVADLSFPLRHPQSAQLVGPFFALPDAPILPGPQGCVTPTARSYWSGPPFPFLDVFPENLPFSSFLFLSGAGTFSVPFLFTDKSE